MSDAAIPEAYYAGSTVLVTGGASFIGSALTEALVGSGADVRVVDDLSSGLMANLESVEDRIEFVRGDLRDPQFAREAAAGRKICFHLAAIHGGRGYIDTHPVECTNNMVLDHIVFAAAAAEGVEKIIFASSACVYPTNLQSDETERLMLAEEEAGFDEPGRAFADGEYGWAKLMGELQLRAIHKQFGTDGLACRLFTAYGERENESHAIIALIAKALARQDPYPIWGNGRQTRNFTYVRDTVKGMLLAAARLKGFETLNIGRSVHETINEVVDIIFDAVGWRPSEIRYELDKPVGVKSRASDNTKILRLLDWEPSVDTPTGLDNTIRWYRDHTSPEQLRDLSRRLMDR